MELILITGGSCSGKTRLSNLIQEELGKEKVNIISMDDYYFSADHFEDNKVINWDVPEAYNLKKFKEDVFSLIDKKTIRKKIFLYGQNIYKDEDEILKPKNYLIVEGIFSYYFPEINEKAKIKLFLDTKKNKRYDRRLLRDSKLERNFSLKVFSEYWNNEIKTFEKEYLKNFKKEGNIFKTNNLEKSEGEILKKIIKCIKNN